MWETIGITVLTNGGLVALLIFVFKKSFEALLAKSVALYSKKIELENNKIIHSYGKIFDEQASVIKDIYSDLVSIHSDNQYLIYHFNLLENHPEFFEDKRIPANGDPIKWEKYLRATLTESREDRLAKDNCNKAKQTLLKIRVNRIFFPRHVADELDRFVQLALFISSQFENVSYRDPHNFEPVIANEVIETWKKVIEAANRLFPELEDLFRKHLRIEETIAINTDG